MLKKEIKYEDFDGNPGVDTLYFNLTKTDLVDLQMGEEGGLMERLQTIIETNDRNKIYQELKRIILASYGVKSEDGKRFVKNDEVRADLVSRASFDALIMEMIENEDSTVEFIKGVMPKELAAEIERAEKDGRLQAMVSTNPTMPPTQQTGPLLPPPAEETQS